MGKTVTLELPEDLVKHWESEEDLSREMKETLVLELVRKHELSFREGARFLDMHYQDFLDLMSEHDVPMIDLEPRELKEELESLGKLMESKK